MDIALFSKPEKHPFGMLRDYDDASQKEGNLMFMLSECIEAGGFGAVETRCSHPAMVRDGLLEEVEDGKYRLTVKAIGLLYSVYGKKSE